MSTFISTQISADDAPKGPSKSELKKQAKAAEKEKKAAEKAAKQAELAQKQAEAEVVRRVIVSVIQDLTEYCRTTRPKTMALSPFTSLLHGQVLNVST